MNTIPSKINKLIGLDKIPYQDVNYTCSVDQARAVIQLLIDSSYITEERGLEVSQVAVARLNTNIDPHDDEFFAKGEFKQRVFGICTQNIVKQDGRPDTPDNNYFYSKKDGFMPLGLGKEFWFNCCKEHAVMVTGKVTLVTLWFDSKGQGVL